jgi:hypothetical protein
VLLGRGVSGKAREQQRCNSERDPWLSHGFDLSAAQGAGLATIIPAARSAYLR